MGSIRRLVRSHVRTLGFGARYMNAYRKRYGNVHTLMTSVRPLYGYRKGLEALEDAASGEWPEGRALLLEMLEGTWCGPDTAEFALEGLVGLAKVAKKPSARELFVMGAALSMTEMGLDLDEAMEVRASFNRLRPALGSEIYSAYMDRLSMHYGVGEDNVLDFPAA